jgi:hypothetical protein
MQSIIIMWSSYERTWFSGPDKQEMLMLVLTDNIDSEVVSNSLK